MAPMSRLDRHQLELLDLRDSGDLTMLSKEMPQERGRCQPMLRDTEEATTSTDTVLRDHPLDLTRLLDMQDLDLLHQDTTSLRLQDMLQLSVTTSSTVNRESKESIWNTRKSSKSTRNNTKLARSARTFARESSQPTGLKSSLTS